MLATLKTWQLGSIPKPTSLTLQWVNVLNRLSAKCCNSDLAIVLQSKSYCSTSFSPILRYLWLCLVLAWPVLLILTFWNSTNLRKWSNFNCPKRTSNSTLCWKARSLPRVRGSNLPIFPFQWALLKYLSWVKCKICPMCFLRRKFVASISSKIKGLRISACNHGFRDGGNFRNMVCFTKLQTTLLEQGSTMAVVLRVIRFLNKLPLFLQTNQRKR